MFQKMNKISIVEKKLNNKEQLDLTSLDHMLNDETHEETKQTHSDDSGDDFPRPPLNSH